MGERVQKHLDNANSAWHELEVTFAGQRGRTMICHMLRYLVVTVTLLYYSNNVASTSIRALLGGPFEPGIRTPHNRGALSLGDASQCMGENLSASKNTNGCTHERKRRP